MSQDMSEHHSRNWAMFCHLSALIGFLFPYGANLVGPLVVWLLKKDQFALVDQQGRESLNFQITWTIAFIIAKILVFVLIGVILIPAVYIAGIVLVIYASVKVKDGESFRYPFSLRIL